MDSAADVRHRMQGTLRQKGREDDGRFMQRWWQLAMEGERDAFFGCARHERYPQVLRHLLRRRPVAGKVKEFRSLSDLRSRRGFFLPSARIWGQLSGERGFADC